MRLEPLSIRDPDVQTFLWEYLDPTDVRHDYTKLDAMKEIERQVYNGDCILFGDMAERFMFRVFVRNPRVCEPHIMGDGTKIRSGTEQGLQIAWAEGFEQVVVWTQHAKIARIMEHIGFTLRAHLPQMHMGLNGEMFDCYALTKGRPNAL